MTRFRRPVPVKTGTSEFEAMLDEQFHAFRKGFDPGERVRARVLAVTDKDVVLDVRARNEGLVPAAEMTDGSGEVAVRPGDELEVTFVGVSGGALLFTSRPAEAAADRTIAQAAATGLPVEGKVVAEINGGYEVEVCSRRAFCPYSQISLFRQEGASYVGRTFPFLVQEYDPDGRDVVVSRRALLERERDKEREALKAGLVAGSTRKGKVTRITGFGFFVDLGGAEGLVPMREISWRRDVKPGDVVKEGDIVEVLVSSVDWERDRISLSLRATQADPMDEAAGRYPPGSVVRARITRLEPFGAFAELLPGAEGLIPVSALASGRRIARPAEVVSVGQELDVRVESIDLGRRRISLRPVDHRLDGLRPRSLAAGERLAGVVEGCKDFGVFIRLSEKATGLLHVSETGVPKGPATLARLEEQYPPGKEVEVVVKENDGKRISLARPGAWSPGAAAQEEEKAMEDFRKANSPDGGLGSLGDAFAGLGL